MNKWEREVQASLFSSEEDALKALEQEYKRTLQSIMDQVKLFDADIQMLDDAIVDAGGTDEALMSQRQSKAYQRQFQNNLKAQIEAILDKLHSDEYSTINDYLNGCYKDAFVGSEYALAMQGVPVITPVRPEAVTKAVLLDSKVVKGYYARIGIDIAKLKPKIASEITRGIASAMSYADIARNLDAVSGSGLYNAKRIVRTEGHRIQQAAWMDSAEDAKAHGADLVRIWSSTLDGRTRETHRMYDGETAEVGGKFKLNGRDVDAPGYFGVPSEDCNCRCVALSRPRWALNDPVRKNDGFNGKIREFDTPDDYEDFKEKYWGTDNTTYMDYLSQLEQKYGTKDYQTLLGKLSNKEYTKLNRLETASPLWNVASDATHKGRKSDTFIEAETRTSNALKSLGVDYNKVELLSSERTFDEIVNAIAGGDETSGSCASVALAYAGQKQGWDVLDFRDGKSRSFFSYKQNQVDMFDDLGVQSIVENKFKSDLANAKSILKKLEPGKEYYLSVGRHAAIVRKLAEDLTSEETGEILFGKGTYQYLELQNAKKNGWKPFEDKNRYWYRTIGDTFKHRFGCSTSTYYVPTARATDISQLTGDDFRTILGYINTQESEQRKGKNGTIK